MDDLHAGITAGAITGLLIPTLFSLVAGGGIFDLQGFASRVSAELTTRGMAMPLQWIIVFMALGFLVLSIACAGLGIMSGVVFVKVVNRIPISSIYFKSLGSGLLLYFLVSLPRLAVGHVLDMYTLVVIMAESVIFGFLFVRWTKRPLRHHVPKSNTKAGKRRVP